MSISLEQQDQSIQEKPTVEKDGYEIIYRPLGSEGDLPSNLACLHIGFIVSDAIESPIQSYVVYDPKRIEAAQYSSQSLKYRKMINRAMRNDGYTLLEPSELDAHVTAVRSIIQPTDQPTPEAPSSR